MQKETDKLNECEMEKVSITEIADLFRSIASASLRIIMSHIPDLALYSQVWSEWNTIKASLDQKKIEKYLADLKDQSKKHEAEITQRIKNVEYSLEEKSNRIAVLERIIDCLVKEYEFPKVQLLAQVTVNCIIDDSLFWDKKIRAIDSFRQITLKDFAVLKQFTEKKIIQVKDIESDSLEALIPSLCKLSSIGLIFEMPYTIYGEWTPSIESEWKNAWPNKYYEILPAGQELLKMIAK